MSKSISTTQCESIFEKIGNLYIDLFNYENETYLLNKLSRGKIKSIKQLKSATLKTRKKYIGESFKNMSDFKIEFSSLMTSNRTPIYGFTLYTSLDHYYVDDESFELRDYGNDQEYCQFLEQFCMSNEQIINQINFEFMLNVLFNNLEHYDQIKDWNKFVESVKNCLQSEQISINENYLIEE